MGCEGESLRLDIVPMRMHMSKSAVRSVSTRLSAVRSFAKWLEDRYGFDVEIIGDDSVKIPSTLPRPVEREHISEALEIADLEERVLVLMLYGTGMRISELSSLRRGDISSGWLRVTGKGNKSRDIPIPSFLRDILDIYMREYPARRYLFEKDGVPLSSDRLRYRVKKIFSRIGIEVTPHRLRHSYASHLLDGGAGIEEISRLLGHSSMVTTQIYTRLGGDRKMKEYMSSHPLATPHREDGDADG
jgi:integrase/recombinase XerC